jgi:hypothetical protein
MLAETCISQLDTDWPDAPDWVRTLATACDEQGQATVARELGVSATLVSQVRRGLYGRGGRHGDLSKVEQRVRGRYLGATILCPVKGQISAAECLANQKLPLITTNRSRVALYQACRSGCPNSRLGGRNGQ